MLSSLIGFGCGAIVFSFLWWRVHRRMCLRFLRHLEMERLAESLQKRRESYDFGRDIEIQPDAGPAGFESSLFEIRPGRMFLNHLDSEQNSTRLNNVNGSEDQDQEMER